MIALAKHEFPFKSIPPFAEKRGTRQREVDLHQVIRNIEMLLPRELQRNVELILAEQELPVMIDMAQFEAALLNLIRNAREAMPEEGRITISTGSARLYGGSTGRRGRGSPKTWAFVSVSDTGSGMDEETLPRIFEPFYTTKGDPHQGLGLPMASRTISQHNGAIDIETRSGHGTTVKVYLPFAGRKPTRRKAIPLPPAGTSTLIAASEVVNTR